jgi:predicted PurR-regulated permease PerM
MSLTLSQVLFLILTIAAVVVAIFLVRFFIQLRRTAAAGEKALKELRKLAENLNNLQELVKVEVEDLGKLVEASKTTAVNLSQASVFLTTKLLRPAASYWPLVYPLLMYFFKRLRKRKEKKNGG